jgi:hypothetical protein
MRPSIHTMLRAAAFALAGCTGAQPLPYPASRPTEEDQNASRADIDNAAGDSTARPA